MKILVIGHAYIAAINREKWKVLSARYPDAQIKVLIPKTWPATLFNLAAGDLSKDKINNCEFISIKTFKSGNEVLYGYNFFALSKILKAFKPDLIHVEQGDNAFSYFQAIILSKLFCRKAKFTFFTWVNWKQKRSLKYKLIWSFIERFNLKNSFGAFVGNDEAREILKEKGFVKPIKVLLQLGVNQKYFIPAKIINKNSDKKYLGFIGRIIKEKGVFLLIDAFARLASEFKNWNLLFVGNGKAKEKLINYVSEKGLNNRIQFKDSVCHEQISGILNNLDGLILPSYDTSEWKEQFGHVLIEAMACKVPVLGSSGGYISNVIGDSGLVFKQKDENDLLEKLKGFFSSEELRKKMSQRGHERFKEKYSYEIIAEKTYDFWNSCL